MGEILRVAHLECELDAGHLLFVVPGLEDYQLLLRGEALDATRLGLSRQGLDFILAGLLLGHELFNSRLEPFLSLYVCEGRVW